jgi:hypothetical protein
MGRCEGEDEAVYRTMLDTFNEQSEQSQGQ